MAARRSSAWSPPSGIGLIAWRGDRLRAPGRIDSPVSREAAFLANNLLFAGFAFVVLLGHRVPAARRGAPGPAAVGRRAVLRPHDAPIGLALLFLMAVGAGAAVAGGERRGAARPAARPGVGGRAHDGRRGRARRARARAGAHVRARRVRARRASPASSRRRRRAAARHGESVRRGACGRCAATRACTAGSSCTSASCSIAVALAASSGYTTQARGAARARASRRRCAATRSRTSAPSVERSDAEDDGQGARAHRARRRRPRRVRAGDLDVPELAAGHRHAVGAHRVSREDVYLTLDLVARRATGRRDARRAVNPMVLWLWIGGGVMALGHGRSRSRPTRRRRRAVPTHRLADERRDATDARAGRRCRREAPRPLDRAAARRRSSSCSASCSRVQRRRRPERRRRQQPARRQRRRPTFTSRRSTASTRRRRRRSPATRRRELLEHVVHPVPPGAPRSGDVLRPAHGRTRLRDGRHRARRHRGRASATTSTPNGHRLDRSRSTPGARPRSPSATRGQPETFVIAPDGGDRGVEVRPVDGRRSRADVPGRRGSAVSRAHVGRGSRSPRSWSSWCRGRAVADRPRTRRRGAGARARDASSRCPVCEGESVARQQRRRRRARSAPTSAHRIAAGQTRRRDPPGVRRRVTASRSC